MSLSETNKTDLIPGELALFFADSLDPEAGVEQRLSALKLANGYDVINNTNFGEFMVETYLHRADKELKRNTSYAGGWHTWPSSKEVLLPRFIVAHALQRRIGVRVCRLYELVAEGEDTALWLEYSPSGQPSLGIDQLTTPAREEPVAGRNSLDISDGTPAVSFQMHFQSSNNQAAANLAIATDVVTA